MVITDVEDDLTTLNAPRAVGFEGLQAEQVPVLEVTRLDTVAALAGNGEATVTV